MYFIVTLRSTFPPQNFVVEINLQVNICTHGTELSNGNYFLFYSRLSSIRLSELGGIKAFLDSSYLICKMKARIRL